MRLPNWERRLSECIVENRERPFEWGRFDCILWACTAAEAMTGEDWAAEYRGRYDSAEGARKALREIGAGTLLKTIDAKLDRRSPGMARRGDFVWFKRAVGVCVGGAGLFVGEARLADAAGVVLREGLITIPRACFEKAWTV